MTNTETSPSPPMEGLEEWVELVDQALQGLHHVLNSCLGSISAQLGDSFADEVAFANLTAELARLEECDRVVRLLPHDAIAGEETLVLDDLLADVLAIHRYVHDTPDLEVTIAPARSVEPVRVERWAVVRVLALLLADAKRLAKQVETSVRVTTESDDSWVRVEFQVGEPPVAETPGPSRGPYAALLAETFGGKVDRRAGVAELRMPTLESRRAPAHQQPLNPVS
jgi:hypothetical protein